LYFFDIFERNFTGAMAKLTSVILLALIAVFAFSLTHCTKSKQRDYVELDDDSSVIKHFNFLPGTYWIYKDAFSGRIDSFYVRSNRYAKQEEAYTVYDYHFITIVELNMDHTAPADSANWVFDYEGNQVMMDYDYTTFAWGWKNEIQYRPLFRYPYVFGSQESRYDTASLTQIDSALIINGQPYYNVAHVYHSSNADSTEGTNITKLQDVFYLNDSVGLIEMTLNHPYHSINRDWKLLRCNIVK
jgi:hypothetical protein